jgi:hypothetical protein
MQCKQVATAFVPELSTARLDYGRVPVLPEDGRGDCCHDDAD